MLNRILKLIAFFSLSLLIVNCANRGRPSGGDKDETPPVITKTEPENYSTNFSGSEIKIYFDEYIKIENLQRNLILSPPMDPQPEITPLGSASNSITIKIFDTLQPNTTYAFNFGESIVDNNEENPYPFYRFVFSTGPLIDSLRVNGTITDALNRKAEEFVSVMLYEIDSSFSDSIIYKNKPNYITNTLDSTATFQLDNIKEGQYLLVALKDENSNYTFQQKTDKIGFVESYVNVPTDSLYTIELFKEKIDFKATRPNLISGQKIAFGYEGSHENMKLKLLSNKPEAFKEQITKDPERDTLNYWYKPKLEVDSLVFELTNNEYIDTLTVRINDQIKDSLQIRSIVDRTISFTEDFELEGNTPISNFDKSYVTLIDKDSSNVDYSYSFDSLKNRATFKFDKKETQTYNFTFLPGAFTDFFGVINDTLNYRVNTRAHSDYGDLRITLQNATYPLIVQLIDQQSEVEREVYLTASETIDLEHVAAGLYHLRVIYDTNKNGKYDPGIYLQKTQSERVSYYPQRIEIRANWAEVVNFILLD